MNLLALSSYFQINEHQMYWEFEHSHSDLDLFAASSTYSYILFRTFLRLRQFESICSQSCSLFITLHISYLLRRFFAQKFVLSFFLVQEKHESYDNSFYCFSSSLKRSSILKFARMTSNHKLQKSLRISSVDLKSRKLYILVMRLTDAEKSTFISVLTSKCFLNDFSLFFSICLDSLNCLTSIADILFDL